jgi:YbbR domain-containing protein
MKKNKPTFLLYALPVIAIVFAIMIFLRKNNDIGITTSTPNWECAYENTVWKCDVTFSVQNNTHKQVTGIITVRGVNLKKSNRTMLNALSEPAQVPYDLAEYEKKDFYTLIYAKMNPKRVNLTVVGKQKHF